MKEIIELAIKVYGGLAKRNGLNLDRKTKAQAMFVKLRELSEVDESKLSEKITELFALHQKGMSTTNPTKVYLEITLILEILQALVSANAEKNPEKTHEYLNSAWSKIKSHIEFEKSLQSPDHFFVIDVLKLFIQINKSTLTSSSKQFAELNTDIKNKLKELRKFYLEQIDTSLGELNKHKPGQLMREFTAQRQQLETATVAERISIFESRKATMSKAMATVPISGQIQQFRLLINRLHQLQRSLPASEISTSTVVTTANKTVISMVSKPEHKVVAFAEIAEDDLARLKEVMRLNLILPKLLAQFKKLLDDNNISVKTTNYELYESISDSIKNCFAYLFDKSSQNIYNNSRRNAGFDTALKLIAVTYEEMAIDIIRRHHERATASDIEKADAGLANEFAKILSYIREEKLDELIKNSGAYAVENKQAIIEAVIKEHPNLAPADKNASTSASASTTTTSSAPAMTLRR